VILEAYNLPVPAGLGRSRAPSASKRPLLVVTPHLRPSGAAHRREPGVKPLTLTPGGGRFCSSGFGGWSVWLAGRSASERDGAAVHECGRPAVVRREAPQGCRPTLGRLTWMTEDQRVARYTEFDTAKAAEPA
jgi:hypothetical protein